MNDFFEAQTMVSFTPAELEVMQVLWDQGPLNPIEMQNCFPRPIHNATLRSVLLVLLDKGHVERHKVGRSYVYRARTPQQNTFIRMVRRISDVFCGGSPTALIAQIIKSEKLTKDDIAELQRVIRQETNEPSVKVTAARSTRRKRK